MNKFAAVILFLTGACLAFGQEVPRIEVFGGYAFSHNPGLPLADFSSDHGWETAFKYNLTSRIGLVAEIDGRKGTDFRGLQPSTGLTVFVQQPVSTFNFLFGPEVNVHRYGRVAFHLRGLLGFVHASDNDTHASLFSTDPLTGQQQFLFTRTFITNTFAAAFGGNMDIRLGRGFSWRAVQPEALVLHRNGRDQTDFRVATGLVFNFGNR